MAKFVFTKAYMRIKDVTTSTPGSSKILILKQVSMDVVGEVAEVTDFNPTDNTREFLDALNSWTMSAEFNQDHVINKIDHYLWDTIGRRIEVKLWPVKPPSGSPGVGLGLEGIGILSAYTPFSGTLGDAGTGSFNIQGAEALVSKTALRDE